MQESSLEFRNLLYSGKRNYKYYADIKLKDGTMLYINNEDIWQGGFAIDDSVSSDNQFEIGAAIINTAKITLNNIEDKFSEYDFSEAECTLSVGLELEETGEIEKIPKGIFSVDEAQYNGAIIELKAFDNMRKFDIPYSESLLEYPANLGEIVRDVCNVCDVELETQIFTNSSFQIQTRPDDEAITCREILSWAAQIACCFARCNTDGKLELKWFAQEVLDRANIDGGYFDTTNPSIYESGDDVDGGTFNPWNTGDVYDAGTFNEMSKYHNIYSYKSHEISTDDVIITGVRVVEKTDFSNSENDLAEYEYGEKGYIISIEDNELISGGAGEEIVEYLGEKLVGFRFRKAKISHLSDPTIEAGDIAFFTDRKQNVYPIIVSSTIFSSSGFQNTYSSAETPQKNSETRYSASTKNYVEQRRNARKEISEYDKAVQRLTNLMAEAFGVFKTEEIQENGSVVYYMHTKPTLEESQTIWKMTGEAFAVSTDGGKTWNAGVTAEGEFLVNVLSAIGISFEWAKGGTLTLGGANNTNGLLRILDAAGKQVGAWNNGGIIANAGTIGGYTVDSQKMFSGGVGMSSATDHFAFWAGETNAQHGTINSNAKIKIGADGSGTFKSVTIDGSTITGSSLSGSAGTISGGTYSSPYLSGGSMASMGGSYVGSCSGSSLSSCSLIGTSLATGNGSAYIQAETANSMKMYAPVFVYMSAGGHTYAQLTTSAFTVGGDFSATGSKNRIINTKNFGARALEAFETPLPTFSDYGKARLDENGVCPIVIDPIFAETVDYISEPTVFLTKYGEGDLWVDEENSTNQCIVIRGTPNLKFSWETRCLQANCRSERIRPFSTVENADASFDYALEADQYIANISTDYGATENEQLETFNNTSIDYGEMGCEYYYEYERKLLL